MAHKEMVRHQPIGMSMQKGIKLLCENCNEMRLLVRDENGNYKCSECGLE